MDSGRDLRHGLGLLRKSTMQSLIHCLTCAVIHCSCQCLVMGSLLSGSSSVCDSMSQCTVCM